jgi:hypothetical protein
MRRGDLGRISPFGLAADDWHGQEIIRPSALPRLDRWGGGATAPDRVRAIPRSGLPCAGVSIDLAIFLSLSM